ncbi:hypothetical protein [Vibrio astriarenae]|uniref:hypothetical protein n=1 Tax=Vibrio astriarenae TaxID=1481923 RepID=UPI00373666EC
MFLPTRWIIYLAIAGSSIFLFQSLIDAHKQIGIYKAEKAEQQKLFEIEQGHLRARIKDLDQQLDSLKAFEENALRLIAELQAEKRKLKEQHNHDIESFRIAQKDNVCGVTDHGDAVGSLLKQ